MKLETFNQNKKAYIAYNNFRKHIFSELNPRDSEIILYMLPWMLSINDPAVPGFISELKRPVRVHGIDADEKILKREATFKKRLNISKAASLLAASPAQLEIQGI
jgi:adenylate cyclase, class 1